MPGRMSEGEKHYGKPDKRRSLPHAFQKGNTAAAGHGHKRKKNPRLVEKCRIHTTACVDGLANIMMNEKERARDRISAIEVLLGYGFGRPRATVDLHSTLDVTEEFLEALKEINSKETAMKVIEVEAIEEAVDAEET